MKNGHRPPATSWLSLPYIFSESDYYTRLRNSGSEEVFRKLVMDGIEPAEFPESDIGGMAQVFGALFRLQSFCNVALNIITF